MLAPFVGSGVRAVAQIEAVEHDISDDHDGDEHKPYRLHSHLLSGRDWRARAHVAGGGQRRTLPDLALYEEQK